MVLPGRKYSAGSGYRYGFNGKEKADEIKGDGNSYDYGARIYDPRLGRWLSTDPLQQKYADLSPYNYCANSPISAKDPDGRVIIFINGLWTPLTKVGEPLRPYWNAFDPYWIKNAQNRIGDHSEPIFYDGSLGGAEVLAKSSGLTNSASFRESAGKKQGYDDAKAILGGLTKGETIKIVTNSMGTAFARGFTKGILKYQTEENERRSDFNAGIDSKVFILNIKRFQLEKALDKVQIPRTTEKNNRLYQAIDKIDAEIKDLTSKKKELLNVQFESETDLSSHQTDYANPDVKNNYYMTTNYFSQVEKVGVRQKEIRGAKFLGNMDYHHSGGANPAALPVSTTPDPNPPHN